MKIIENLKASKSILLWIIFFGLLLIACRAGKNAPKTSAEVIQADSAKLASLGINLKIGESADLSLLGVEARITRLDALRVLKEEKVKKKPELRPFINIELTNNKKAGQIKNSGNEEVQVKNSGNTNNKKANAQKGNKVKDNSKIKGIRFSWWWLLLLLIPIIVYQLWKQYKKRMPLTKIF